MPASPDERARVRALRGVPSIKRPAYDRSAQEGRRLMDLFGIDGVIKLRRRDQGYIVAVSAEGFGCVTAFGR